MIEVHGPDGRVWRIQRRPDKPGATSYLAPGPWRVDATTDDEQRRWVASGWLASSGLRDDVALALRTGSEGPAGEVALSEQAGGTPSDGDGDGTGQGND